MKQSERYKQAIEVIDDARRILQTVRVGGITLSDILEDLANKRSDLARYYGEAILRENE